MASFMDWWFEWVLFLPLTVTAGLHGVIRLAAIVVYVPWFFAVGALTLPLILAHVIVEVYLDSGKP